MKDCDSVGILDADSLKKRSSNLLNPLQSKDLFFSELCWVNAASRFEYHGNVRSAKVAVRIFNETMWVKMFLILTLNSTGCKLVIEIGSNIFAFLTTVKCNELFSLIFSFFPQ